MSINRVQDLHNAPLADLVAVLFRQMRGLLAEAGVQLSENEIRALAPALLQGPPPPQAALIRDALVAIVTESITLLHQRWRLDFAHALVTDMDDIPGWETTAEFIDIANEKGNAELRIAVGAILLLTLGDLRYVPQVLAAIVHNPDELETITAQRLLAAKSGIALGQVDWPGQVLAWWQARHVS